MELKISIVAYLVFLTQNLLATQVSKSFGYTKLLSIIQESFYLYRELVRVQMEIASPLRYNRSIILG